MALSLPRTNHLPKLTAWNEIHCRPECRLFSHDQVNKVIHISTAPRTGQGVGDTFKLNPNDTALLLSISTCNCAFVANHWHAQNVTPDFDSLFYQLITHLQ